MKRSRFWHILLLMFTVHLTTIADAGIPVFTSLGTDYTGSVVVDNTIFIYGENGVMMRSTDQGSNWTRFTIPGPFRKIKGVVAIGHSIYAADQLAEIYTTDIVTCNWQPLHAVSDMLENDSVVGMFREKNAGNIVIVSHNSVTYFDSTFQVKRTLLDSSLNIQYASIVGNTIMVANNVKTYILDRNNGYKPVVWKKPAYLQCSNCLLPSNVCDAGDSLLVKYGIVWYIVSPDMQQGRVVEHSDGLVAEYRDRFTVLENSYDAPTDHSTLRSRCFRETSGQTIRFDTLIQEDEYYVGRVYLSRMRTVGDSTIVAFGKNNTIVVSRDGGRTWHFKSYNAYGPVLKMRDSLYGITNDRIRVITTKDGNCTWLPQKMTCDTTDHGWFSGGDVFYLDSVALMVCNNANGWTKTNYRFISEKDGDVVYGNIPEWRSVYSVNSMSVLKIDDRWSIYRSGQGVSSMTQDYWYTTLSILDSNYKPLSVKLYDSLRIRNVIDLGLKKLTIFTSYRVDDYNTSNLYESTDGGESWTKYTTKISAGNNYDGQIVSSGDFLFVPSNYKDSIGSRHNRMEWIEANKYESHGVCFEDTVTDITSVVNWKGKIYYGQFGSLVLHYAKSSDPLDWLKIAPFGYLSYHCFGTQGDCMLVSLAKISSGSISSARQYGLLTYSGELSSVSEAHVENDASLYLHSTYPNPCKTVCKSHYSHDDQDEIGAANISLYDINGFVIDTQGYSVDVANTTLLECDITLDLTKIPSGIYVLRVRSGTGAKSVKILKL